MSKVAVITGAASGIGLATVNIFKRENWRVVGVDRSPMSETSVALDRFIEGDVSEEETWQKIADEISQSWGTLEVLVNNAAVQICKPLVETSVEEWDRVMAVNLRSIYLAVKRVYPLMRDAGGAIVNVSSVHAIATSANIAAYAASKGGVLALTRALAIELAGDRIRVNAVLPGAVDTPMLRSGLNRGHLQGKNLDELLGGLGSKHIVGRIGQPREIAEAIYFLGDDRASFITGQALVIDGGATARLSTE